MKTKLMCLAMSSLCSLFAADTAVNLLITDKVEPAHMHGEVTGVRGWMMHDHPRRSYISKHDKYFSGEDCFKIDVKNGEATLAFPDPLPAPYAENPNQQIFLITGMDMMPPAEKFHSTGRVRVTGGVMGLSGGPRFNPSPDWQNFDYKGSAFHIFITPAAGASFSFADLKMTPFYSNVGGEIALPDGGKLTRLLLPENANFVVRWGVCMWRGWLWKLTGVALPIETAPSVTPAEGAFAALPDSSLKKGWRLQVGKAGIILRYSSEDYIASALFDYLRMSVGYTCYAPGVEKMPKLPVTLLPPFDRTTNPRYNAIIHSWPYPIFSGGQLRQLRYMTNSVDYYHDHFGEGLHYMNCTLPLERYFKEHPEYFMMDADGERSVTSNPSYTQQCYSNDDARKIMVDGLCDYYKAHPWLRRTWFEPGDAPTVCQCPKCVEFNGNKTTNTDLLIDFTNQAARELKKINPNVQIFRCAYLARSEPPRKVKPEDSIHIFYCLTDFVLPCTLHTDCEKNRKCMEMAAEWKRALGNDASRIGLMTYDDLRPLQFVRLADALNKYASGDLYMFQWHYTPLSVQFIMPRWNLGENPDKLMDEFDHYYYGKAGDAMHKLTLLIDEYGKNYKHRDNEGKMTVLFCGVPVHARTVFDRETFDKMYAILDEAIAAAGDDKNLRARIFEEKKAIIAEDFMRFGPATCTSEAELDALIKRIVDFITMAREFPSLFGSISADSNMRKFMLAATSLDIPNTGKFWANEPYVDNFLAAPKALFSAANKIPGGIYFSPLSMKGSEPPSIYSYKCPSRYSVVLRRQSLPNSTATINMTLDEAPRLSSLLSLEGQDDEKPGASRVRVRVNGMEIYSGPCLFPEMAWGRMGLTIPAGCLRKGENSIEIANITADRPSRSTRFKDPVEAANDPQWGWFILSEVYWHDPNNDFVRYVGGNFTTPWCFNNGVRRGGVSEGIDKGKVVLAKAGMGPAYHGGHRYPTMAVSPNWLVKMTVRASGSGTFRVSIWNYRPYNYSSAEEMPLSGYANTGVKILHPSDSQPLELTPDAKVFTCVLKPAKGTGLVIPRFYADKGSRAEVSEFQMELIPPDAKWE